MKTSDDPDEIFELKVGQFDKRDKQWQLCLSAGYYFTPIEGCVPNRFHRFMHRVMFGFKWERQLK